MKMKSYLVIVYDEGNSKKEVTLEKDSLIIGRSDQSDIQVIDKSLSREHAKIERISGTYFLSDLGSANGTMLHGIGIAPKTKMESGQSFHLGQCQITLVLERDESDEATLLYNKSTLQHQKNVMDVHENETIMFSGIPAVFFIDVTDDRGECQTHPLADGLSVGRGLDNTVIISDPLVSRNHIEFQRIDEHYNVVLKSSNKMFVNKKPCKQLQLKHGDIINIGNTMINFRDGDEQVVHQEATMYRSPGNKKPLTIIAGGVVFLALLGIIGLFIAGVWPFSGIGFESRLIKAESLQNSGRPHAAIKSYQKILKKYSGLDSESLQMVKQKMATAEFQYGQLLWNSGRYEKALAIYESCLHKLKKMQLEDLLISYESEVSKDVGKKTEGLLKKHQIEQAKNYVSWLRDHMSNQRIFKQLNAKVSIFRDIQKQVKAAQTTRESGNMEKAVAILGGCGQRFTQVKDNQCNKELVKVSDRYYDEINATFVQLNPEDEASVIQLKTLLGRIDTLVKYNVTNRLYINKKSEIENYIKKHEKTKKYQDIDLFESGSLNLNDFKR